MKYKILLLLLLIQRLGFCQSGELVFLRGRIVCPIKELYDVNVFNIRSESSTVTNKKGNYSMFVKVGDTLKFSSVQIETKKIVIQDSDLLKSLFVTSLVPKVIELDEVEIKKYKNINAVSLGILDKPAKKFTPAERRLQTAGDFKPIHLLGILGGQLPLDPIINSITGRTAMLKKEVKIERKELLIQKIENQFEMDYFIDKLKIPKEYVRGFWYYAVEDEKLVAALNSRKYMVARFIFSDLAEKYLEINVDR